MTITRRHCMPIVLFALLVAQLAGLPLVPDAAAQAYPTKVIKLIAPYPPGGGVDTVARLLAERLSARLGQQVVVDNKPGAGATIGGEALAKSAQHVRVFFGQCRWGLNANHGVEVTKALSTLNSLRFQA